jgi:RNA polymerase sigma factor (sigma-70 family)
MYLLAGLKNVIFNTFSQQDAHQRLIRLYGADEPVDDSEEDQLADREEETMLQDRIAGIKSLLTDRQQEIIHYRFVEDLSIEEIAKLLDINYQSVANIIQRALKKIRQKYLKN